TRRPRRAVTSTESARPSRTNHARSPGRTVRLTRTPAQPLTGRQWTRSGRSITPSTRSATDINAIVRSDCSGSSVIATPKRTSHAVTASTQRRYFEREIHFSTVAGTGAVGGVISNSQRARGLGSRGRGDGGAQEEAE